MNLVLGLVFANTDGSQTQEPWQYLGVASVDDAVAGAHVDGVAAAFGRRYLGVGSVVALDGHDQVAGGPFAGAVLHAVAAHVDGDAPTTIPEIEAVPWWQLESAFGPGTLVGVHARRCLVDDVEVATAAAEIVGEASAHQMTLSSVTPAAVLAMGALLEQRLAPPVRDALRGWLDVIAESAGDDEIPPAQLRASLVEGGTPEWLVDDLVARAGRSAVGARGAREAFVTPLFDRLEKGKHLGEAVVALRAARR